MNFERTIGTGHCRDSAYRRKGAVFALLASAATLFFSVVAFGQGTTGTLRGQVLPSRRGRGECAGYSH